MKQLKLNFDTYKYQVYKNTNKKWIIQRSIDDLRLEDREYYREDGSFQPMGYSSAIKQFNYLEDAVSKTPKLDAV